MLNHPALPLPVHFCHSAHQCSYVTGSCGVTIRDIWVAKSSIVQKRGQLPHLGSRAGDQSQEDLSCGNRVWQKAGCAGPSVFHSLAYEAEVCRHFSAILPQQMLVWKALSSLWEALFPVLNFFDLKVKFSADAIVIPV